MRSWVAPACAMASLAGCGSRTGLFVTLGVEHDAAVPIEDAAPPPPPPLDALADMPIDLVVPAQAPEGVYTYALGRFDPRSGVFSDTFQLSCLASVTDRPIAIAPSCDGTAYIQFAEGDLWAVDGQTFACEVLHPGYAGQGLAIPSALTFGISPSGEELLYFYSSADAGSPYAALGSLDRTTLRATTMFPIAPLPPLRMTATAAADLFLFAGSQLEELDQVTQMDGSGLATTLFDLPAAGTWSDQPFAFWGGAFYFFDVQSQGTTDVVRFALGDTSAPVAARSDDLIIAAGVSPCAPLR